MQQEEQIIVKSGGEAKKARGLTFHDDTVLLSQSIANNPNIGLVLSSGREAQARREAKQEEEVGSEKSK